MSCQMVWMSCQKIFLIGNGGCLAELVGKWGRKGSLGIRWKGGWMWSKGGLGSFSKFSPFSPSHCAPLFALNEASNFEFEFLAPYYPFWKCANPLFLTKGVIFVLCLCLLTPSQFLALQATPKGCGAHVGPPTREKHHIVKNDQNALSYLKCK